jgi:hypothetical protein
MACKLADHAFATPHMLLALLEIPGSRAAACFELAQGGLAEHFRQGLRGDMQRIYQKGGQPPFRPFEWIERFEVRRGIELAIQFQAPRVSEAYILLGILENQSSKMRQAMAEHLGPVLYERLCRAARARVKGLDTPGSVTVKYPALGYPHIEVESW